jgi:hypothetical protein
MILPPPQMFSTSGEEFSFTLSTVHRADRDVPNRQRS